jgi:hypothetical protein
MDNFYRLTAGVNTIAAMNALMLHPEWWNTDRVRTTFDGTPHGQADDILLRFGKPDGDDLDAADHTEFNLLPGAKDMALDLMRLVRGTRLGRVVITRLRSGARILPHADVMGAYAAYYTRYHVVLQGLPGSLFVCGDETVNMQTGEIWWFNAAQEHSVINNSVDDRIHMLVDVRID